MDSLSSLSFQLPISTDVVLVFSIITLVMFTFMIVYPIDNVFHFFHHLECLF
jgi:hypothetical protein